MRTSLFFVLLLSLAACAGDDPIQPRATTQATADPVLEVTVTVPTPTPAASQRARAELQPMTDNGVEGTVDFTKMGNGVRVVAFVRGLDDGLFGLHIHEGSSCERQGQHFNPANSQHGDPTRDVRHWGDLGNIRSERGRARYDRVDTVLRMDSTDSIIGRVVAVHAGQDDLNSQPSGGSGDITACGIIEGR